MSFEQMLRDKLSKAPFKSRLKDVLKVVLGEVQLKSTAGPFTDEQGYNLVKSLIKTNVDKVLVHLGQDDPRRAAVEEENAILSALLPAYLSKNEVVARLKGAETPGLADEIRSAKSEGMATGIAMKYLKGHKLSVEGDTVKLAVQELRA